MFKIIISVACGSACGGVFRWFLSEKLNPLLALPLGTLFSNLIAGYVVGFSFAFFSNQLILSNNARLFMMTGLCGGLSTFSTFSLEVVKALQNQEWGNACLIICVNLIGSLILTCLGIWSYSFFKS